MTPARVTLAHVRAARYCMSGVRAWSARHGWSFEELRTEGWDADKLEATGDALAMKLVELARADDGQQ